MLLGLGQNRFSQLPSLRSLALALTTGMSASLPRLPHRIALGLNLVLSDRHAAGCRLLKGGSLGPASQNRALYVEGNTEVTNPLPPYL
jgi:hypothetical protein